MSNRNQCVTIFFISFGAAAFLIGAKGFLLPTETAWNIALPEYDFVIIGSGPAGCVLAHRLTENPNWNVLLLEAGKPETIVNLIPLVTTYLPGTDYNWDYTVEPNDDFCWGMEERKCSYPRGKALGGTSTINNMIYNRGNYRDFDGWAADGNDGWSYQEVLPYFLKSERANLRGKHNSPYHNRNGLLSVEDVPWRSKGAAAFVMGSLQVGHRETDYNGFEQLGVSFVQATTQGGRRHSAASAFIRPILHRPNLHILTSSRVTKVLIDPPTKTAYGVEYLRNKKQFTVKARLEVILSAGAFSSPQLLMLSGVGAAHELNTINVPLVHDLPGVGQNMYDHISHFGPTFLLNTTRQTLRIDFLDASEFIQYVKGRGMLSSIGCEALNFIKARNSRDPADFPDLELLYLPGSLASDHGTGIRSGYRVTQEIYDAVYKPLENINIDHFTMGIMLFHPRSKGYMQLISNNIFHRPHFYPNYFSNTEDVETMLEGIKEAIRISQSPAMQELGARLHDIPLPNCAHLHFGSDDYWRCSIRTLSLTLHHQIGTCKMGPQTDQMAVVDPQLRVHGINRLRIADTSIIPKPPTSHTNAASFMIGEKAADMIKATWQMS